MTISINGTVGSSSQFQVRNAVALNTTYVGSPSLSFTKTFATTDVTKIYFATLSVTSGGTTLNVIDGSLTDIYGNALVYTTVKHLQIVNNSTTINLTAGGGSNALVGALPVLVGAAGGGCVNVTTNITTSGTVKNLALTAASGTISVDVYIVGN